jgi:5-methylcytosine-specific restriction endonuclease McrA
MRTVPEWIGKSDNTQPPDSCQRRILDHQRDRCNNCGVPFGVKVKAQFDHVSPIWLGGENRESNLQALCSPCHAEKTKTEATARAKVNRLRSDRLIVKKPPKGKPLAGTFASGWKKRMDGTVVKR